MDNNKELIESINNLANEIAKFRKVYIIAEGMKLENENRKSEHYSLAYDRDSLITQVKKEIHEN